jgi:hypothetical protein
LPPTRADASFETAIDGVSIAYSGDGASAFFDPSDLTLTIVILESGGNLKISGGIECALSDTWDGFVDVFLVADTARMTSISVKGTPECEFFLAGYVEYVEKLSIFSSFVGDLFCYPRQFGLYASDDTPPKSITIKNGWAEGSVLGTPVPVPVNLCL